jgi:hypothetical protein
MAAESANVSAEARTRKRKCRGIVVALDAVKRRVMSFMQCS